MNNERIKAIFLEHGFTVKPGQDDLKPYVYAAARALLAAKREEERSSINRNMILSMAQEIGIQEGFDGGIGIRWVSQKDDRGNYLVRNLVLEDLEQFATLFATSEGEEINGN